VHASSTSPSANLARVLVAFLGLLLAGLFVWATEALACKPHNALGFELGADTRESNLEALQAFVIFSIAAATGKAGGFYL